MNYVYRNELYHHGVKGQKWGQRNYQNPDGSLTPEGRIHYGYNAVTSTVGNIYNAGKRVIGDTYNAGKTIIKDASSVKRRVSEDASAIRRSTLKKSYVNPNHPISKMIEKHMTERDAAVKNRKNLSDEELKQHIERLQNEKKLKDLSEEVDHPVAREASKIGKQVLKTALAGVATYTIYQGLKHFKDEETQADIEKAIGGMKNAKMKAKAEKAFNSKKYKRFVKNIEPEVIAKFGTGANPFKKK